MAYGAVGLISLRFASVGIGFLTTLLLSRGLGVDQFGVFSFVISLATLLSLPLAGGLPMLLTREIAAASARDEPALRAGVVRWAFYVLLGISMGLALLIALAYWAGQTLAIWPLDAAWTALLMLLAFLVPALSLQQVQRGILAGHGHVVLGNLGEQLFRPGTLALLLLALGPLIWPLGAKAALALQLAATVAGIILSFGIMARVIQKLGSVTPKIKGGQWARALMPLTAISAISILNNNFDILMLGVMVEPAEVGVYRIAAQVAVMSTLIMQILNSLSAPTIAAAFAQGDKAGMQVHFIKSGRAMFAASATFVVVFAIFGRPALVMVFGQEYAAAWAPCLALSLGAAFSSASGLVGMALQMTENAGFVGRSAAIAALVNTALNVAFIPLWGALGAAIATAIATVFMQARLWHIARNALGMRIDGFQKIRA